MEEKEKKQQEMAERKMQMDMMRRSSQKKPMDMDEEAFAFGRHSEIPRGKDLQESHSTLKGVVQREIQEEVADDEFERLERQIQAKGKQAELRDKFIKTNSLMEFEDIEDQVNAVGNKQTREKSDIVVDLGESVGTELTELIP